MRRSAHACLAILGALGASCAHAATQGAAGGQSTGSIAITVSVAPRLRVAIADAPAVQPAAFGREQGIERGACLWTNTATRGLRIVAVGESAGQVALLPVGIGAVPSACARAGGVDARLRVELAAPRRRPAGLSGGLTSGNPGPLVLLVVPE